MAMPWLRILNAAIGVTDLARRVTRGPDDQLAAAPGGPLEARLAGVVVAALKEAFDRDSRRLELERDHIEAERARAERALRLELLRQAADREIGRLRLMAGVAVAGWIATLFLVPDLVGGDVAGGRAALAVGWLLLLAAIGASFSAQTAVGRALAARTDGGGPLSTELSSGLAGAAVPWLIVAGLAAVGIGVLL
jgi:hypothetical protein